MVLVNQILIVRFGMETIVKKLSVWEVVIPTATTPHVALVLVRVVMGIIIAVVVLAVEFVQTALLHVKQAIQVLLVIVIAAQAAAVELASL